MSSSMLRARAISEADKYSLSNRALAVRRITKIRTVQARSLWWWGRHSSWSSSEQEDMMERMARRQQLMRYRYHRVLKRKAMWERDDSPPWSLSGPGRLFGFGRLRKCRPLSTSEQMQAKLEEKESGIPKNDRPWEEFHEDFASFKTAVDKAIERDPYGTLFGRRLQAPLSSKFGWTSFSRLWDIKEIKEDNRAEEHIQSTPRQIKIETTDPEHSQSRSVKTTVAPNTAKPTIASQLTTAESEEYIFDPVSGRKVPNPTFVPTPMPDNPVSKEKSPFLQSLFNEHGAEESASTPAPERKPEVKPSKGFGNSRAYEYSQLRAANLGNNINTTAEYSGKYGKKTGTGDVAPRSSSDAEDDAPLFSGTTYETMMSKSDPISRNPNRWLQQNGFQESIPPPTATQAATDNRLEPSIDRLQESPRSLQKKFITKLQPAVDRVEATQPRDVEIKRPAPLNVAELSKAPVSQKTPEVDLPVDRREDIDLLRASDVRAAVKTTRETRRDNVTTKAKTRDMLEQDFQDRKAEFQFPPDAKAREEKPTSDKSMHQLMKHVQRYPDGVVARTLKSTGILNENFKLYQKPRGSLENLNNKLEWAKDALEKLPSIYKKANEKVKQAGSIVPYPAKEVIEVEQAKLELTNMVKTTTQGLVDEQTRVQRQVKALAASIFDIYESEQQRAGESQTTSASNSKSEKSAGSQIAVGHPLSTATVKPGVVRDEVIEKHITEFEPKYIELKRKTKELFKGIDALSQDIAACTSSRQAQSVTEHQKFMQKSDDPVRSSFEAVHETRWASHADAEATDADGTKAEFYEAQSKSGTEQDLTPKTADQVSKLSASDIKSSRVQQISAMRVLNEKLKRGEIQVPKQEAQHARQSLLPTSPYVILTYDKPSGDVGTTEVSELLGIHAPSAKISPMTIMGNLNYPAAFVSYFHSLKRAGYELCSGGGDLLVFQKRGAQTTAASASTPTESTAMRAPSGMKNAIAAQEAASQPRDAATVLDEIPEEIPHPGPAAPVAPPTSQQSMRNDRREERRRRKLERKVRRQEQVFSGERAQVARNKDEAYIRHKPKENIHDVQSSLFDRFSRGLTKTVLITVALASGVYVLGVASEGISAQTQQATDEVSGPRKKIVMPNPSGTRPGIFSTESSRE